MRCDFDTSPCRSGGGARELEILRQLGATPPALLADALSTHAEARGWLASRGGTGTAVALLSLVGVGSMKTCCSQRVLIDRRLTGSRATAVAVSATCTQVACRLSFRGRAG